jgi:hypothetical protein
MLHFGRGENVPMTPQPYRNAYDTALAELTQIAQTFEQLRARKGQIEGLIQALQPFFSNSTSSQPAVSESVDGQMGATPGENTPHLANLDSEPPEGYSFRDVPNPLPDLSETGGDPFQRRAKANFRFRGLAAQRSY